jgi:hypothetical protein
MSAVQNCNTVQDAIRIGRAGKIWVTLVPRAGGVKPEMPWNQRPAHRQLTQMTPRRWGRRGAVSFKFMTPTLQMGGGIDAALQEAHTLAR